MKCSEAQDVLSAYHDDQLSEEMRARVAEHLHRCSICAEDLQTFKKISQIANDLGTPVALSHLWSRLAKSLDRGAEVESLSARSVAATDRRGFQMPWRSVGLATIVVAAMGLGWLILQADSRSSHHHHFSDEFGHYLSESQRDAQAGLEFLLKTYENQPVTPGEAIHQAGYRPAVADGLPAKYTLASTHVLKMPCCTCVHTLCSRPDGSALTVFEHNDDDPRWFGDRPAIFASCSGERCCLVDLGDRLAVSWKRGRRHITLVGVRDMTEVIQIVAWLNERNPPVPR